jgi:hypothetical protein
MKFPATARHHTFTVRYHAATPADMRIGVYGWSESGDRSNRTAPHSKNEKREDVEIARLHEALEVPPKHIGESNSRDLLADSNIPTVSRPFNLSSQR